MGAQAQSIILVSNFFKIMGVFIPSEFYKDKNLKGLERDVLALYKYYTENGKYKCCSMTCQQIADEFDISVWYINKIKKHLKELGYIRSSGVKVVYIGLQDCTTVQSESVLQYRQDCTTVQNKTVLQYRHKKDINIEKKEKKREMTNFDRLIGLLSEEYVTPERKEYIEEKYKDRINKLDMADGAMDGWIVGIKNELNTVFPVEFHIEKEEERSDTIDVI